MATAELGVLLVILCLACGEVSGSPRADDNGADDNGEGSARSISEQEYKTLRESACAVSTEPAESLPVTGVYWLIDGSASMADSIIDGASNTWEGTRAKIQAGLESLADRNQCKAKSLGLVVYPGMQTDILVTDEARSVDTCVDTASAIFASESEPVSQVLASMTDRLSTVVPQGGTPMADAYRYLADRIHADRPNQSNVIISVTDGMPSIDAGCRNPAQSAANNGVWLGDGGADDQKAPIESVQAAARGLDSYVVDPRASEAGRSWLSSISTHIPPENVGGFGHYELTSFSGAFDYIASEVVPQSVRVSCRFSLLSTMDVDPTNPAQIAAILTTGAGERIRLSLEARYKAECKEGFQLRSLSVAELCPNTCARLKADCDATLEVLYRCGA